MLLTFCKKDIKFKYNTTEMMLWMYSKRKAVSGNDWLRQMCRNQFSFNFSLPWLFHKSNFRSGLNASQSRIAAIVVLHTWFPKKACASNESEKDVIGLVGSKCLYIELENSHLKGFLWSTAYRLTCVAYRPNIGRLNYFNVLLWVNGTVNSA